MGGTPQIAQLAERFLDATARKRGTEEDVLDEVLPFVATNGWQAEFDAALGGRTRAILRDEFYFEAGYRKRLDLLRVGHDTHAASALSYFADGLSDIVDFSSTGAKVAATVTAGGLALLAWRLPPAAALVGSLLIAGTATYGLGSTLWYAGGVLGTLETGADSERKDLCWELGRSVGILAAAAPFVPKAIQWLTHGLRPAGASAISARVASAAEASPALPAPPAPSASPAPAARAPVARAETPVPIGRISLRHGPTEP